MSEIYAIIDTNVIVSSFFNDDSIPCEVVNIALREEGPIRPIVNLEIIAEYEEVLSRNKFGFDSKKVDRFFFLLAKRALFFERQESFEHFIDQDDLVFYEVTLTAKEVNETYLVTGNKKHFPNTPYVVSPREMLDIINSNNGK